MANLKLTWLLKINCLSLDVGVKGTTQRHKIWTLGQAKTLDHWVIFCLG